MTRSDLRLAVFDCDGTLVDSQRSIVLSMQAAFAAHGLPRPAAESVRRIVGLPLFDAVARLHPTGGTDAHLGLEESYREAFRELRRRDAVHEPLFPGVAEAMDRLEAEGWVLGIATGKAHRGLISTLEKHGMEKRFVTLQTADSARGKPHPEMMLNAMRETGIDASRAVMIGDTTFDMEMARNAKTFAIGVAWGYHDAGDLRGAGAHAVIAASDEISGVAKALLEE